MQPSKSHNELNATTSSKESELKELPALACPKEKSAVDETNEDKDVVAQMMKELDAGDLTSSKNKSDKISSNEAYVDANTKKNKNKIYDNKTERKRKASPSNDRNRSRERHRSRDRHEIFLRNPDRPASLLEIQATTDKDVLNEKKSVQRLSSPERWEIKQMIAANCIDKYILYYS